LLQKWLSRLLGTRKLPIFAFWSKYTSDVQRDNFFKSWSELHGNAKVSGIVKTWLSISYFVAKFLYKLKLSPNIITLLGLIFAILLYLNAELIWAPLLLVLSLLSDGIDGSLAIISGKSSKWGALLDAIVDRFSELFWILALYKLGINLNLLIIILVLASVQEYIRARSGGLGLTDIELVTIAERPVRASFVFIMLILFSLNSELFYVPIYLWLIFQTVSLLMLSKHARAKLN
jgi:phosphatidylglycerophosphate synthase